MTPSRRHLVIFAKTPRMGRVKSRLAADIGTVRAWGLYRTWLGTLVRRMAADPRWTTWMAVTPDTDAQRTAWPVPRRRCFGQGGGDLGQRMTHAMLSRPPGDVILIGADIPSVRPSHIADAFQRLKQADTVFGPTPDGGFWLVGQSGRRHPIPFDGVRWSHAETLTDSLSGLVSRRVALAAALQDIDTARDLRSAG